MGYSLWGRRESGTTEVTEHEPTYEYTSWAVLVSSVRRHSQGFLLEQSEPRFHHKINVA